MRRHQCVLEVNEPFGNLISRGLHRYSVLAGSRLRANPALVRYILSARERALAGDWEGLPPILGQLEDWALIPRLFGRVSVSARPAAVFTETTGCTGLLARCDPH